MKIIEGLKLYQTKRFAIMHVAREQSVAEHSYGVALIAAHLSEYDPGLKSRVALAALTHDFDEIETGDIPTPFKKKMRASCPHLLGAKQRSPEVAVCKVADCLEVMFYVHEFGGSKTTEAIMPELVINFYRACEDSLLPEMAAVAAKQMAKSLFGDRYSVFKHCVPDGNGCWIWQLSLSHGYGQTGGSAKKLRAHRVAYEHTHGPIPTGLHVLHRCDIRACINPAHLFLGTNQDNVDDRESKGRNKNGQTKMTKEIAALVKAERGLTATKIAIKYGLSKSTVDHIRDGSTWGRL